MKDLLTVDDVARILRLSKRHVLALADSGELPCINVGLGETNLSRRFSEEDLQAFIDARRTAPIRPPPIPRHRAKSPEPHFKSIYFLAERDKLRAARKAKKGDR